jgi:NCAIR mutase (PurE)-related protein
MNVKRLEKLLHEVKQGKVGIPEAIQKLRSLPFEEIGFATIDHHRPLRQGAPETIFGEGKTAAQILSIMKRIVAQGNNVFVTRLDRQKLPPIRKAFPKSRYYPLSRALTYQPHPIPILGKGTILVICAGTSDIPIAEEAIVTAEMMGNRVEHLFDVGVAGIHRLMSQKEKIFAAHVIIVVAGMEGALPSVVGGLVDRPVIAVPTSVGYGAHLGGFTALLGMLNSCASGVCVVNIDNGYGAGYVASLINRL